MYGQVLTISCVLVVAENKLRYYGKFQSWKSLDGSGHGLIKPSVPNNAYAASQEAGFNSLTTQHTCQPIMAILV